MTKTIKSTIVMLAASVALFVSGFVCTGFTTASAASADEVCNHAYEQTEIAATCTEQGYTKYICADCGDEKKDNYTEVKGHNYTESVVAATCTTAGYTLYSCTDCGHTYTEQTESAKGHTFEVVVVPNTCTHKGYTTHFCTVCGYEYSDNYTDEIGHDYEKVEVAPTCTERGYTKHTCSVCEDVFFDNYIDALGHTYEAVITEPTCVTGGFTTYTCATCADSYIADYTEPNGHAYTETVNAATCVTYGYTDHVCNDCGDRFVTDYAQPRGHKYLDVLVPATPDSLGYTRHICVDCNYSYLSDYVTSGDIGYIPEPEEPVIPEIHKHAYEIQTMDDSENMSLKGTVDAHKCTSLIYTDFEIRSAFVRMYNTLKQNVKIIIDETLAQLNALKVKVNAGNNEIAEIDGEIASIAEQNKVYSELYASGVIDEVTYLGRSDKYKNQITELRSRRLKIINEDEEEMCIEKLRELKRFLADSVEYMTELDENIFMRIIKIVYAEDDGALTFKLKCDLELKIYVRGGYGKPND